jgi:hypothetical protein
LFSFHYLFGKVNPLASTCEKINCVVASGCAGLELTLWVTLIKKPENKTELPADFVFGCLIEYLLPISQLTSKGQVIDAEATAKEISL